MSRFPLLDDGAHDARHALRTLRTHPGFATLAILTLAIGIGATTAIFSVVNATLLRPLPFREPDQLMSVLLRMPVDAGSRTIDMVWSYPKYESLRTTQRVFDDVALHLTEALTVGGADGAERIIGELVSARYFQLLGVRVARGRFFLDEEDTPAGGARTVVIGDGLWRTRFGAAPDAIGGRMEIGGAAYRIVGIAPPEFAGMSGNASFWVLYTSVRSAESLRSPGEHQFEVVARLRPGIGAAAAKSAMSSVGRAVDATYPGTEGAPWGAAAYTLDELRVDPAVRRSVAMLGGAVVVLLLIACINLASLLLARGAARGRELSVRLAIGADAGRIVRQLVTESMVLATLGAVVGIALAGIAVKALAAGAPLGVGSLRTLRGTLTSVVLGGVQLDATAVGFAVVLTMLTGIVVGIAPALSATRTPLVDAMRQGTVAPPVFSGLRRLTGRGALVMTEIALAVVLLVASGLMIRSLQQLLATPAGYDPEGVLTARVSLAPGRYNADSTAQRWNRVAERVAALPGVTSVGVGTCSPVGDHCEGTGIRVAGHAEEAHVAYHVVSPDYFRSLRIPVLRGRAFTDRDRGGAPPVMIVNETAARTIWGREDPLSTPVQGESVPVRVVGVVGDVRYEDIEQSPRPAIFVPFGQSGRSRATLFLRVACASPGQACNPAVLAAALRREIRDVDRNHAVSDVKTMRERLGDATARNRFSTRVLGAFAVVALMLAGIGVYGVLALAVAQRTRELGIRIALGAERRRVLGMIVGQALTLAALGAGLGVICAMAVARSLRSLLYGIGAGDLPSYLTSIVVLAAAMLAAACVPAWRATRVSPMVALRSSD